MEKYDQLIFYAAEDDLPDDVANQAVAVARLVLEAAAVDPYEAQRYGEMLEAYFAETFLDVFCGRHIESGLTIEQSAIARVWLEAALAAFSVSERRGWMGALTNHPLLAAPSSAPLSL